GRPRRLRARVRRRPLRTALMPARRRSRRSPAAAESTGRRRRPAPARAGTEVDGERVNSALAPVDGRSERGRRQFADLARRWETAQFRLAEDEPIIERDFEPALTAR